MTYCLDTNSLINVWRLWYAPQTHPTLWSAFVALGAAGELKIPLQVYEELSEQNDELFAWCKAHKDELIFEPTDTTEEQYSILANEYPELTGSLGLRQNYADLYIVAVAMVTGAAVVSNEDVGFRLDPNRKNRKRRKYKITNVCFNEGVALMRLYEVLRREGWIFRHEQ